MRWSLLACAWILSACAPSDSDNAAAPAEPAGAQTDADGWRTLFDGTDLNAFMAVGDANWTIEGDAVRADAGEGGHLVTTERFDNFELEAEFFVSPDANSGIFVRCDNPEELSGNTCYEVNIYDTRPDQSYRSGGLVNFVEPAVIVYTGGRWNRYQITADGTTQRAILNGHEMYEIEDSTYAEGHITLQFGTGVVMFRNVRIRTL